MFGPFKKQSPAGSKSKISESEFWSWFEEQRTDIEHFIDSTDRNLDIFHGLTAQMKRYNNYLFPELSKSAGGKYILVITPDGISEGLEPTQKLANECPGFNNWEIKKFRQPNEDFKIEHDSVNFLPSDIKIIPEVDEQNEKVNIRVFIRNMEKDEMTYQQLAFLYFDHILGEFNVITRVGYIDFHNLSENQSVKDSINLIELRKLIEKELY